MSVQRLDMALQLAATSCETDRLLDELTSSCVAGNLIGLATTLPQRHLTVNARPHTPHLHYASAVALCHISTFQVLHLPVSLP